MMRTMTEGFQPDADRRWIVPEWSAPRSVRAFVTTRDGGSSGGVWAGSGGGGMNLGFGSGDDRDTVVANRALLAARLPSEPAWLRQVHGVEVVDADTVTTPHGIEADASFTTSPGRVCAVLVADCLPVLFADRLGKRVAAAHAGWRGLAAGVLEETVRVAGFDPDDTLAWIGPAIGPSRFEVGNDVRDAFLAKADGDRAAITAAFVPNAPDKWLADLPALARARLAACGVQAVRFSGLCTASDPVRFYSYRRDGTTGRMVAVIWIEA
jgi:YfiH family protein